MIRIGITMGDPKGVGPEIIARAIKSLPAGFDAGIRIYGDRAVFEAAANLAKMTFDPKTLAITSNTTIPIGEMSDPDAARAALLALDAAVADVKNGVTQAIITAPVNKQRMQSVNPSFIGHTEFLAKASGAKDIVMMFAGGCLKSIRVSLVTSHLALKDVPSRVTKQRILTTVRLTHDALIKYFDCATPRIGILGLNPHAGENGALGKEELETIMPAIMLARKEGINCLGPIQAEMIFSTTADIDFDAVVAMYHDQGLTPMKIICGKKAVNITLGLPFIRTSPGHGTAEDIAWSGNANEEGMIAAIEMAKYLLRHA